MHFNFVTSRLAGTALITALGITSAHAAIIKIEDAGGCQVTGLDSPESIQGGTHCDVGDVGFSLTDLLNGDLDLHHGLLVGDSQTPKWNILNDTGALVTDLPLWYSGMLADNSFVDMQVGGNWFDSCESVDSANPANVNSDASCGSGDKTLKPEDGGVIPMLLTWSSNGIDSDGIGIGETFRISTASFASGGDDAGCISGTSDCMPIIPIPAAAWLFGSALVGLAGIKRKK